MNIVKILVPLSAILLFGCGPTSFEESSLKQAVGLSGASSIVGGHPTPNSSPLAAHVVSLIDTKEGSLCTGVIVSENAVITAAHCVGANPKFLKVVFDLKLRSQIVRSVREQITLPRWSSHQNDFKDSGDLALVHFDGGLPAGARPASLLPSHRRLQNGETVVIAGYGISVASESSATAGPSSGAGVLREAHVQISNSDFSSTEVSLDQRNGSGACHGDSGGPAFIKENRGRLFLWGITSRSLHDTMDQCNGESIYTRIEPYSQWILSQLQEWNKNQ